MRRCSGRLVRGLVEGHGEEVRFAGLFGDGRGVGVGTWSELDDIAVGHATRVGSGEDGPVEHRSEVDGITAPMEGAAKGEADVPADMTLGIDFVVHQPDSPSPDARAAKTRSGRAETLKT